MRGFGLIKGLALTFKKFFSKKWTRMYPEERPPLPPNSRGSFTYIAEKCISCNLCAEACPNGVIRVDSHKNDKGKKVLDQYNMNLGYCLFCGYCVDVCPTKCLTFNTKFEISSFMKSDTIFTYKLKPAAESAPEETPGKPDTENN